MSIKTGTGMSIAGHDEALGFESGGGLGEMARHTTKYNGFSDVFAQATGGFNFRANEDLAAGIHYG